jgi:hypothetical protein
VAAAQQRGQAVVGEAVASGLALDESALWHPDFDTAAKFVMSPPIRSLEHQHALRAAVSGGVLQLVGTDHAVFNSTQKRQGFGDFRRIVNGVNGIEERLHVVWHTMVCHRLPGLLSKSRPSRSKTKGLCQWLCSVCASGNWVGSDGTGPPETCGVCLRSTCQRFLCRSAILF